MLRKALKGHQLVRMSKVEVISTNELISHEDKILRYSSTAEMFLINFLPAPRLNCQHKAKLQVSSNQLGRLKRSAITQRSVTAAVAAV